MLPRWPGVRLPGGETEVRSTDVRHDCRFCSHSNDSHDPLIGCLYPNCMCANKSPANFPGKLPPLRAPWHTVPPPTIRRRKTGQRRFWRATLRTLQWFLGSIAAAVLAGLLLAGTMLIAIVILLAKGGQ